MRYLSAYMLCVLGGNEQPSIDDLKKVLGSVGIDCEEDKAKRVISTLKGQNVDQLISKGKERLATMPAGGGVAVSAAVGGAAAAGGKEAAKEDKKEDKKEEKKKDESESDEDMGFGLFD